MSQKINLQEATREELIGVVRHLNGRLEALKSQTGGGQQEIHQLRLVRKELEDRVASMTQQVSLLKQELLDKDCEAKATREQVVMLTERAATDEALILELQGSLSRTTELNSLSRQQDHICDTTSEVKDSVTSLREANDLLTAALRQHREEKRSFSESAAAAGTESASFSVDEVHGTLRRLRREVEESRRTVQQLQDELNQKELETTRMVRWIASKSELCEFERNIERVTHEGAAAASSSAGHVGSVSETEGSSRNSTDEVANPVHQRNSRTQMATLVHSAKATTNANDMTSHRLEPLPPMRGMTPREKKLSERISLLEHQLVVVEEQLSRERSAFAELDKHRSEMILSANQALEHNAKEISSLQRMLKEGGRGGSSVGDVGLRSTKEERLERELEDCNRELAAARAAITALEQQHQQLQQQIMSTSAQEALILPTVAAVAAAPNVSEQSIAELIHRNELELQRLDQWATALKMPASSDPSTDFLSFFAPIPPNTDSRNRIAVQFDPFQ
jgi:hypothetical protein